jgi:cytochrome o ubiquinol oxidase subunit 1
MFGKLSLDSIPYHEPIIMVTAAGIALGGALVLGLITYFGKWRYLWTEWLTSVDHHAVPRLCGRDHDAYPASAVV